MASAWRPRTQFTLACAPLPPAEAVCRARSCAALVCAAHFDAGGGRGRVPHLALVHPHARRLLRLVPLYATPQGPLGAEAVFEFAQPVTLLEHDAAPQPQLRVVAGAGDLYTGATLEGLAAAASARPHGARVVVAVPPGARERCAVPDEALVGVCAHPQWLLCAHDVRTPQGLFVPRDGWDANTAYAVQPSADAPGTGGAAGTAQDIFVGDSGGTVVRYTVGGARTVATRRVVLRLATHEPVAQLHLVGGGCPARVLVAVGAHGRVALCTAQGEALAEFAAPAPAPALAVARTGTVLCATRAGIVALDALAPVAPPAPRVCVRGVFHRVVVCGDSGPQAVCAAVRTDGTVTLFTPAMGAAAAAGAEADHALGPVAARLAGAAARHGHLETLAAWLTATLRVHALVARLRVAGAGAPAAAARTAVPHVAYERALAPDGRALLVVVLRNPTDAFAFGAHRWTLRTVVTQANAGSDATTTVTHCTAVAIGAQSELRTEVPLVLPACMPFAAASTLVCDADTPADRAARKNALAAAHALYGAAGVSPRVLDAVCAAARALPATLEVALPVPAAERVFTAADYLVDAPGVPDDNDSNYDSSDDGSGRNRDTFTMSVGGVDAERLLGGAVGPRGVAHRHVAFLPVCAAPPVFAFEVFRPARDTVVRVTLLPGAGGGNGDDARQRTRLLDGMHASLLYRVLVGRSGADTDAVGVLHRMLGALRDTRVQDARALAAGALRGEAVPGFAPRLHERLHAAAAGMRELLQVCDTSAPETIVL